jgi:hypothetical protein
MAIEMVVIAGSELEAADVEADRIATEVVSIAATRSITTRMPAEANSRRAWPLAEWPGREPIASPLAS